MNNGRMHSHVEHMLVSSLCVINSLLGLSMAHCSETMPPLCAKPHQIVRKTRIRHIPENSQGQGAKKFSRLTYVSKMSLVKRI